MRALHWLTGKRERRDELLSAYLDGELDKPEQARLEAQLAGDPALQAELETLRQTVTLVHEMPHIPAPRNFFLPQATAARPQATPSQLPRRSWSLSLLTTATIVVSLIFAVVLTGDILRRAAPGPRMAYESPQEIPAPEMTTVSIPTEARPAEEVLESAVASPDVDTAPADESITPAATLAEEKEGGGVRQYTPEETAVPPSPAGGEPAGTFEGSRARPVALEIALGLVALTLAAFTVRAWLRRH